MSKGTVTSTVISSNARQTVAIARRLGRALEPGDVVALIGELGSGKTVFTKGLAAGLGFEQEDEVTSPSFKMLNQYQGRVIINHFDAYRLNGAAEFADIGGEDLVAQVAQVAQPLLKERLRRPKECLRHSKKPLQGHGVCVIEWAERVAQALPQGEGRTIWISIKVLSENARALEFSVPQQRAELISILGKDEGKET